MLTTPLTVSGGRAKDKMEALKAKVIALQAQVDALRASLRAFGNLSSAGLSNAGYVCPFGAPDGISKQAWVANQEGARLMPRDVGHLLWAKDGIGANEVNFVLGGRRDSMTGRVEGVRDFFGIPLLRRSHSYMNDGGKEDQWKGALL
jgi:hypothetical protein